MGNYFRIKKIEEITPSGMDGHKYRIDFETGPGISQNGAPVFESSVEIETTKTLQAVWGMTDDEIARASGDVAAAAITPFVRENQPEKIKFIAVNTATAPSDPSKLLHVNVGDVVSVSDYPKIITSEEKPPQISFLGKNIAETRDHINAISKEILGEKLLDLPQERALFDMYKIPVSSEEFGNRIASLAGLAVAINTTAIEKYLKKIFEPNVKSIAKLEELVKEFSNVNTAKEICDVLRSLNKIRQGYPIHSDNVGGVVQAHDFFHIGYPVSNFSSAWEKIANTYFETMKKVLFLFKQKREKPFTLEDGSERDLRPVIPD